MTGPLANGASGAPNGMDGDSRPITTTSQHAIHTLFRLYEADRPIFPIEHLVFLQAQISQHSASQHSASTFSVTARDHFDDPYEIEFRQWGAMFLFLRSLHSGLENIIHNPPVRNRLIFYQIEQQPGNPAIADTNFALTNLPSAFQQDLAAYTNFEIVHAIFAAAKARWDESEFWSNLLWPKVIEVLPDVGSHIDKIICFELGTFEADLRSRAAFGTNPALIFQHFEYTFDTTTLLESYGARVIGNTVTGFTHITENSLVIWTGGSGPFASPVKQIIADFPFQIRQMPLPLPRAMIWPKESDIPTTLESIVDSASRVDAGSRNNVPFTEYYDTPRTNRLHQHYRENEIPDVPEDDIWYNNYIPLKLAIYTRPPSESRQTVLPLSLSEDFLNAERLGPQRAPDPRLVSVLRAVDRNKKKKGHRENH
ncbi:hypothetical protein F4777DRAFT_581800 [Nemania sp. FL0916]|nr:hypothetical protein F4777DRAFT_581800 [Nemania sp. FL0916]